MIHTEEFMQKHYKPQPVRADYKCKRQQIVNNTRAQAQALGQAYLQGTALASAGGRKKESALKQGERRAAEESHLATSQTAPRNGSTAKGGTRNPKGAHPAQKAPEGQ